MVYTKTLKGVPNKHFFTKSMFLVVNPTFGVVVGISVTSEILYLFIISDVSFFKIMTTIPLAERDIAVVDLVLKVICTLGNPKTSVSLAII